MNYDILGKKSYYDFVTDAWRLILGDNFHFGYFKSTDMDLSDATNALIEELAKMGNFTETSKILDVGCGIGTSAFYLHEKFHCSIIGITDSERGLELARKESESGGYSEMVQFQLADALDNGSPDSSFDVVWVMESSHLMVDKEKLFSESYRVLKDGGVILLCDVMSKRRGSLFRMIEMKLRYGRKINILEKAFGNPRTENLGYYLKGMQKTGFSDMITRDISKNTFPTIGHWRKNIIKNQDKILQSFSREKIDEFLSACDILESYYRNNILGYGLIKAVKR